MSPIDLKQVYIYPNGILKSPLASVKVFFTIIQNPEFKIHIKLSKNEIRALENLFQFIGSFYIILSRIRKNLDQFKPDSWTRVNFDELFVDAQTFFLFVQQFLEDLILVYRLSLERKKQITSKFSEFLKKYSKILSNNNPLKLFLDQEKDFFKQLKDIRDDICHRTHFDRIRDEFPDFMKFIQAAGGKGNFISAKDLKTYLSDCMKRTFALGCFFEDTIIENLKNLYPAQKDLLNHTGGYIVPQDSSSQNAIRGIKLMANDETLDCLYYFLDLPIPKKEQ